MKKQTYSLACILLAGAATVSSCKKDDSTPATTTPATNSGTPNPAVGNVDGALVSLKVDLTALLNGTPYTVSTENGVATFFSATGNTSSFVDAGAVSVNSVALDKGSNNGYTKSATVGQTPADLSFESGNSAWSVAGAGSVPAISYTHNIPFPAYTGTLPASISRSTPFTVSFSGKVTDADSVIIFITKDSHSIARTFAGNAASGTISAADLSTLPVVSDNTALLEIIPYRITLKDFGRKSYAFIKEHAVTGNISIQ